MKILWESWDWPGARIEPGITYLAWIEQNGSSSHGFLGVGSESGAVGITMTDIVPVEDENQRYNFNLRGHNSAIYMVTWNGPQGKLASCDSSGVIYVWVRNDERWSVELVNDRGVKVRDLSWSPCGSAALICYEDNFVLIGSSTGQRVWSNSFPTSPTVNCGVWAPDSRNLVLGFSTGTIQVLSDQGANITERSFTNEAIVSMAFSPEKNDVWTLAMLTSSGRILMVNSFDQIDCYVFRGDSTISRMQWNSDGSLLALTFREKEVILLDTQARCVHRERINAEHSLTALTWAHDGHALIVAAGGQLAVGKVLLGVPSLFQLVSYDLWKLMGYSSKKVEKLPLPVRERQAIRVFDRHIIRCRIPRTEDLCNFVCTPNEPRCYCTIRPVNRTTFVLCIEHMGGLVPVLIGRQVNRFLPLFHISLHPSSSSSQPTPVFGSSAQVEDVSQLSRASTGRNSLWRRSKRQIRALMSRHVRPQRQDQRLAQVSSNVWCTRFNITSMTNKLLPEFLGQVVYKTSVLHLQPRQMTIDLSLLSNSLTAKHHNSRRPSVCPTPSPSEIDDDSRPLIRGEDEGLTREERAFFERVVNECASLRAAMTNTTVDFTTIASSQGTSQVSASKESPARVESRQDDSDMTLSTTSTWHDEIDSLEYIDGCDDSDRLIPSTSTAAPCPEPVIEREPPPIEAFRKDLQTDLDRLIRIAGQLSVRYDFNMKRDRASIDKMQLQMKDLLRKVHEIEKKVGNDDVRSEVRHLMRTLRDMKKALGEGRPSVPQYNMLTMHNKTPFWNEHNQVYQLDFGGRVTQESAKNFQVELDNTQVLQFGRIDGGYTLDFRKPFSACQAFAVALASITQRLK